MQVSLDLLVTLSLFLKDSHFLFTLVQLVDLMVIIHGVGKALLLLSSRYLESIPWANCTNNFYKLQWMIKRQMLLLCILFDGLIPKGCISLITLDFDLFLYGKLKLIRSVTVAIEEKDRFSGRIVDSNYFCCLKN